MKRILSIDYGTVRTGFAITDSLQITAQGLESFEIKKEKNSLINKIKEIIANYDIEEIVMGYPRHMSGDKSKIAEEIDILIEKLSNLNIKVITWDERLTTVNAYKTMKDMNVKQTKKKEYADRLAATYILEDYLKYKKN